MRPSLPQLEALAALAFLGASVSIASSFVGIAAPSATHHPASEDTSADAPAPPHRNRATPVADYTLDVSLDTDQHTVDGSGTITWRNHSERPVDALYLHLYANAFRSNATQFLSDRRPGGRGTGPVRDFGHLEVKSLSVREHGPADIWPHAEPADPAQPEDRTDMRVPLLRPVQPGSEIRVDVAWTTKLPSIVERMGYAGSFHMVAQWFPKIARLEPDGTFAHFTFDRLGEFYADFGTYDVTISVPAGFTVGATGPRLSDVKRGDRRVVRHVQPDVHDFAFCAYDGFEEKRRSVEGVDVRLLHPPGYTAVAEEQMEAVAYGLRQLARSYGRYPYSTLTLVHPPEGAGEANGMEYPTLITTGGRWWRYGAFGSARAVTLHELAHQWFYGLVATNEWRWPFLDEGLTTFAEVDVLDEGWGDQGALRLRGWGVRASTALRFVGAGAGHDDVIAQSAPAFESGYSYGRLVYARTALVLETLDRVYEGGMRRALGRYARAYRFAHPDPKALIETVEETMGAEAAKALETCLYERGWIDLAIEDLSCAGGTCALVVTRRGSVVLPVTVRWLYADGTSTQTRWDGRDEQATLELETTKPVSAALLDPLHAVLLDEDLANNAISRRPAPGAWRTRGALSFLTATGLSVVSP